MCFPRHLPVLVLAAAVLWGPATASANDLTNGSFENGLQGWGKTNARVAVLTGQPPHGLRFARAHRRARGEFGLIARPAVNRGQRLSIRARLRAPRGLQVCVRVRERRSSGALVGGKKTCRAATGSWQRSRALRYTVRRGDTRVVLTFYAKGTKAKRKRVDVDNAVLTKTSGGGGSTAAPGPIAGKGYHQVFRDNFNTLGSTSWGKGIWYSPSPPANSIFVQNGVLNLVSRRSQGYQDITVTTEAGTSPKKFTRGYFEARMKWTKGKGAWPAFWLSSYRHATNQAFPSINPYCQNNGLPRAQCLNSELDVFEGQGLEPHVFYGALHRSTNGYYGVPDSTNDHGWKTVAADLTNGWHKYGALWTASQVRWYLDGVEVLRAPTFDSTNQPMFLLFDMWIGWSDNTDASTPNELKTQIDYVTVWQK
jgi:beta-glucanase (GH16 family)